MLLAVDIGNTHTVVGLFPGGDGLEPAASWRTRTVRDFTEDELAAQCAQMLELHDTGLREVDACIVSSVVPAQAEAWRQLGRRYLRTTPLIVGPGVRTGMPIRVDNPHEVGADRIVNGVAAYERYGSACIVIDMGTATTLDAISADGAYLGGAIAPGLGVSVDALVRQAARLASVELLVPPHAIGTSTVTSMQSGAVLGCVAQLEGLLQRFRVELAQEHDGHVPAIATGGLATLVAKHVHGLDHHDPDLTLRGLAIVAARQPA
jgi:type III pantothenate kinase